MLGYFLKNQKHIISYILLLIVSNVSTALVPNIEQGKIKSTPCAACHNADGNSTLEQQPKIAGQPIKYLVSQLLEFKKNDEGNRANPVMYEQVKNLSEQDIYDLAGYFATFKMSTGKANSEYVSLGQQIYKGGNIKTGVPACSACHGPKGESNGPGGIPRLAGQDSDYVIAQLEAYQSGARNTYPQVMQAIAKKMSKEEIEAVSEYIKGLY